MKNLIKTNQFYPIFILIMLVVIFAACGRNNSDSQNDTATLADNPFAGEYDTPYLIPPFDRVQEAHFLPAFKKGMELEKQQIDAIVNDEEPPTFANTLVPLEKSGRMLERVSAVFWHLNGTSTTDGIQAIAREVTPLLSQHGNYIALNEGLFQRVKTLYQKKDSLDLDDQQRVLLEETYRDFVRSGADLEPEVKEKIRKINEEMSGLALEFRNNLLKETNAFKLFLDSEEDLEGLPPDVVESAAKAAAAAGEEGKWLFTLHKPSWIPFLQNSPRRDLREKLYRGYFMRGDNDNEYDNKKIIARLASLRVKKAKLMGYDTHADFRLEINMAKTPEGVYELLNRLWAPSLDMAREERRQMQAIIDREGGDFKLQSWDWWYYAEKLRKEKYALNEEELKPYFEVNNVRKGAFEVANRLYGITFTERTDLPKPHPDAKVFEVKDIDGSHLGILFTDYFYRESKRGGAWCGGFQGYSNIQGETRHPLVYNVCNFPQPVGDTPSLLSFDQALTLFHEFGHALHVLFNRTDYPGISRVARDFVELPSQIMEHWCSHPEVLKTYARHYKTGEAIPDELIEKLQNSSHFNQGFATVEYLAASLLDMEYHTLSDPEPVDTAAFEKKFIEKIGLIPEIIPRYRSTYFQHIIGGYDAGYYAYIWSEVLDCDAFEAFRENGLYDRETAQSFRDNILSRGGSMDEMVMYKNFRGREPQIDGLLKKRGLQ